jgi:hypothetical protein
MTRIDGRDVSRVRSKDKVAADIYNSGIASPIFENVSASIFHCALTPVLPAQVFLLTMINSQPRKHHCCAE